MIRITYDPSVNAAYIYLTGVALEPGRDTIVVETPTPYGELHMDWKDGKLVGIEILSASKVLHKDILDEAERLG